MVSIKGENIFRKIAGLFFQKRILWFSVPFLIFLVIGGILLIIKNKGDILLALNSVSSPFWDQIFLQVTKIGLGSFIALVGVVLVFYKFRWSLLVFINLAWTGIFTNLFKRVFFHMSSRPLHYFYYDDFPRFLYDAPLSYFNTFPSGHTITIYAICSLLAILVNRRAVSLVLFLLALLVGFSRVYLLQHFFIDTYFGAVTGIVVTVLTFWIDQQLKLDRRSFRNMNLQKIIFRNKN
ncbi:MAG: phosphatase PAP2 family protein [Prolixibacteraceae bacterium]|nr:phosphatase PAP2 family protein [Prolixibacteraceae bacterium]